MDTWWQTETGGIMITPRPGPHPQGYKPGAAMSPFYGVDVALMDPDTKVGILVEHPPANSNICVAAYRL